MGQIMSDYNPVGCIAPYYPLHWPYIWNDIFFFRSTNALNSCDLCRNSVQCTDWPCLLVFNFSLVFTVSFLQGTIRLALHSWLQFHG